MNRYLIAEEGPLAGMIIVLDEEKESKEWSLGRDPDTSDIVLEDPMVSRRAATIRFTPEGFLFENLSTVNPATQNGMVIAEPVLLKEGDILQIGSTFFTFTDIAPAVEEEPLPEPAEEETAAAPSELPFGETPETRWLLKVISGPNAGAEFAMHKGTSYLLGKDPNTCDVVFQDLSVSAQHARLSITGDDNIFIEDLGSRNGVIVNGELISEKHLLTSQDMIALGTTTFLVIDRKHARETIIAIPPPTALSAPPPSAKEEEAAVAKTAEPPPKKDWKEIVIPKRHLLFAGVFVLTLFVGVVGLLALFKTETVVVKKVDESSEIEEMLKPFPGVQFSFNVPSGKLFLVGHVLTKIDQQELVYKLSQLPYIRKVEDTVIVDELVWQNMNALLSSNPEWVGISVYAPAPGQFVLRGYLETLQEADSLSDYIHLNFDYLDLLKNEVVVEQLVQTQIQTLLAEYGYSAVTFQLSNGEVVLGGRIEKERKSGLDKLVNQFEKIQGVRMVKNFVLVTSEDMSRINVSEQYMVTGFSKRDEKDFFVVVNGRIVGKGDQIDGMKITAIIPKTVQL